MDKGKGNAGTKSIEKSSAIINNKYSIWVFGIVGIILLAFLLNNLVGLSSKTIENRITNREIKTNLENELTHLSDISLEYSLQWGLATGKKTWEKNMVVPGTIYLKLNREAEGIGSIKPGLLGPGWKVPISHKGIRVSKSRFSIKNVQLVEVVSQEKVNKYSNLLEYFDTLRDSLSNLNGINPSYYGKEVKLSSILSNQDLIESVEYLSKDPLEKKNWIRLLISDLRNIRKYTGMSRVYDHSGDPNLIRFSADGKKVKFAVKHVPYNEFNEVLYDSIFYSECIAVHDIHSHSWSTSKIENLDKVNLKDFDFLIDQPSSERVKIVSLILMAVLLGLIIWSFLKIISVIFKAIYDFLAAILRWIFDIITHIVKNEYKTIFQLVNRDTQEETTRKEQDVTTEK